MLDKLTISAIIEFLGHEGINSKGILKERLINATTDDLFELQHSIQKEINKRYSVIKCSNCKHCWVGYSKYDNFKGEARCTLLPTPRTKGKEIYWAMSLLYGPSGVERVHEALDRKKKAPSWCPLCKEVK